MSHSRQVTEKSENNYRDELEAPQNKSGQVTNRDGSVFELSGEPSLLAPSSMRGTSSPLGRDTLPQANPWPFYLDDVPDTRAAHSLRQSSNLTSDANHQTANPWPYHGVETDNPDMLDAPEDEKASTGFGDTITSCGEANEQPPLLPGPIPYSGNDAVALDGLEAGQGHHLPLQGLYEQQLPVPAALPIHPTSSETTSPMQSTGQTSTYTNVGSWSSSPVATIDESRVHDTVRHNSIPAKMNNIAAEIQGGRTSVHEGSDIISDMPSNFNNTSPMPRKEHTTPMPAFKNHEVQTTPHESLRYQPAGHLLNGTYSQPPPAYTTNGTSAQNVASRDAESHVQHLYSHVQNTGADQPSVITVAPAADAYSQSETSSSEPRLRPIAPPLPPRSPGQTRHMVGLSNGPHNNVSFPPPPKRNNVPPILHPPPVPQRPTILPSFSSSSKFLGSSSAKKWLDKTNQAIENTLDAVLQGPAGHPTRPAYVSRPEHPSQQTFLSPASDEYQDQVDASRRPS